MARKLKTFVTTIGFFDLAVAAPSMNAALQAWGVDRNLFHQGFAHKTDDGTIVDATMEKPGVVLKRAVGSDDVFREDAPPPRRLPARVPAVAPNPAKPARKAARQPGARQQTAAVIAFDKEKARREKQRAAQDAREEAAAARDEARRAKAAEKAQAVLDRARERHKEKLEALERERASLSERIAEERERWRGEKADLERKRRAVD